jgi:hypothetical protein
MRKENFIYLLILSLLTFTSCQDEDEDQESKQEQQLFAADNLETQNFSISADRDTILIGENGTILTFEKNSFVDQSGSPATGEIKINFKECLDKLDMILGNMTTTSNGQPLESGGMIYLNATSNKEQLMIANNKSVGVEMPVDSVLENMQLFEGVETGNGINWQNPVDLQNEVFEEPENAQDILIQEDIIKQTNVGYYVKDYNYSGSYPNHTFLSVFKPVPPELIQQIGDLCWSGKGITLTKDSVVQIDAYEVALIKMDNLQEVQWANFSGSEVAVQGQNQFREDQGTSYFFSIKKLGWANIDRLFTDPRTKEIELFVTVEKQDDYDDIYTSMIFKNQNMYLPGYQKKDNSFSFTHGDYEKTALPVGETATILVTAYKNEKPFYAIKTITLKEKQAINMELSVTTKDKLKKELENKI